MPQYHARTPSKNFIFYLLIKLEFQRQKVTAATILAWEGPARQLKPKNTIYISVKITIRRISMCNPNHRNACFVGFALISHSLYWKYMATSLKLFTNVTVQGNVVFCYLSYQPTVGI